MELYEHNPAGTMGEALVSNDLTKNVDKNTRWYVAYTLPRHEKAVENRLITQNIETYLPLYSAMRYWNHRRVKVDLPLFPGYVFLKMRIADKVRIIACSGIIRLVSFNSTAAAVSEGEIEKLRLSLASWRAEPYPFLTSGKKVRIRSGPFAGLEGTILRRKGKLRLVVSLDFIQSAILFELDASETQLCVGGGNATGSTSCSYLL
jgi:transcription antitermination factor NusG